MDASANSDLHKAAKAGDVGGIMRFIQGGADVNHQNVTVGATALVYAAQFGHVDAVRQLLQLRANPGLSTRKSKTALVVAQEKGHVEVVRLIQAASAAPPAAAFGLGAGAAVPTFGSSAAIAAPAFGASAAAPAFGAPAPAFGSAAPAFGVPPSPFGAKAAAFGAPGLGGVGVPQLAAFSGAPAAAPSPFGAPAAPAPPLGGLGGLGLGGGASPTLGVGGGAPPPTLGFSSQPPSPAAAPVTSRAPAAAAPTVTRAADSVVGWGADAAAELPATDDHQGVVRLPGCPEDSVSSLCWGPAASPGSNTKLLLSAASWDGCVRVWSVAAAGGGRGGSAAHLLTYAHERAVLGTAISWGGERVFSGGADAAVRSVDLATGSLSSIGSHGAPVSAVATCQSHPHAVLSTSWDKTLAVWDTRQPATAPPVTNVALPGRATALDLQWPHAAVATAWPGGVSLIDLRRAPATPTSAALHTTISRLPPRAVALFPRGDGFCVGSYEGRVGIHFLRPDQTAKPAAGDDFCFKCHRHGTDKHKIYSVGALAFVPGRPHVLVTAGTDGECCAWDVQKRNRSVVLIKPAGGGSAPGGTAEPIGLPALAFSPAGDMLAYARSDDWSGGQPLYNAARAARHTDDVRILLLSPARLAAWDA